SMEQTIMDTAQELNKTVQHISEDHKGLSDKVVNLAVDIQKINAKLKNLVTRSELREMQEYIELMKPLASRLVLNNRTSE
ncbi:MAG: hypothetical protein U9P44_02095, partial [archaeon]|nr:hypothetical protein [archaeon]